MNRTSVTPGPEALRALSHPVRLRLLGLLRMDGPATATTLAHRTGLNTGATSYHLRNLARHGFIEEDAARGTGRERWWRAAHQSTRTDASVTENDPEGVDAFQQAVAVVHAEQLQRAIDRSIALPAPWREAGTLSDWYLRLTPERAADLVAQISGLLEGVEEDAHDTPGALPFIVDLHAFLSPDALPEDDRG